MNFGKIYTQAVSLTPKEREDAGLKPLDEVKVNPIPVIETAEVIQGKFEWLQSPITAALLKDLGNQIQEAEEEARKLAYNFASHQNAFRIIQLLNKSTELRKIIHHYGRNQNSNQK